MKEFDIFNVSTIRKNSKNNGYGTYPEILSFNYYSIH